MTNDFEPRARTVSIKGQRFHPLIRNSSHLLVEASPATRRLAVCTNGSELVAATILERRQSLGTYQPSCPLVGSESGHAVQTHGVLQSALPARRFC
jgi:hypothetical protein